MTEAVLLDELLHEEALFGLTAQRARARASKPVGSLVIKYFDKNL